MPVKAWVEPQAYKLRVDNLFTSRDEFLRMWQEVADLMINPPCGVGPEFQSLLEGRYQELCAIEREYLRSPGQLG